MRLMFLLFAVVILSWACELDPNPELLPVDPKLVVNTRFSPDTTWSIHISATVAINVSLVNSPVIDDAVVEVSDLASGLTQIFLHSGNGYYNAQGFFPEYGHDYGISVRAQGFQEVTSSSFIPEAVVASVTDTSTGFFLNSITYNAEFKITDPSDEENFYFVEAYSVFQGGQSNTYIKKSLFSFDVNTENGEIGGQDQSFDRIYLPDRNFNGDEYSFSVRVRETSIVSGINPLIQFRVQSVSKELYDYLKSYEISTAADFDITFVEPVVVISNIDNGLGIFGGFSQQLINIQY